MAGTKKINSDLDLQGKAIISTVPNSTGTVVTWNPTSKEIGTRSNADIISDLGLITATNIAAAYYTKTQLQTPGQAQVNWGNLTDVPTSFPAAAHNHDDRYHLKSESVPYTGADKTVNLNTQELILNGGDLKLGTNSSIWQEGNIMRTYNHLLSINRYSTAATGILSIKIPQASTTSIMTDTLIRVYSYARNFIGTIRVSFYKNSINTITTRSALLEVGSTFPTETINVGIDAASNICINIGDTTTAWSTYLTFEVERFQVSHSGSNADWSNGWTYAIETDTSTYQNLYSIVPERVIFSEKTKVINTTGNATNSKVSTNNIGSSTGVIRVVERPIEFTQWGSPVGAVVIKLPKITSVVVKGIVRNAGSGHTSSFIYSAYTVATTVAHLSDTTYINQIRRGTDASGNTYIIFNDVGNTWAYPQIIIEEVYFYAGAPLNWNDSSGYEISVLTDLTGITLGNVPFTISANQDWVNAQNYFRGSAAEIVKATDASLVGIFGNYKLDVTNHTSSAINFPEAGSAGVVYTLNGNETQKDRALSLWMKTGGSKLAFRSYNSAGVPQSWNEVWHSGNLPSTVVTDSHTHTNKANLDTINQNLGTGYSPRFSNLTVGDAGTGGLFKSYTPSLNAVYHSSLEVDGSYASFKSVIDLKALGVSSGGGYHSELAFHTTFNANIFERMRLTGTGLGIGTTDPTEKLHVVGNVLATGTGTFNGITVGYALSSNKGFNSNMPFAFLNGSQAQSIYTGGILASNAYADSSKIPTNGIYSKGSIITGGTIEIQNNQGSNSAAPLTLVRSSQVGLSFKIANVDNFLGVDASGILRYGLNASHMTNHMIWHSGNDGSGSGLDADLLDGKHASDFSLSSHTHSWSDIISGKPTTLSGYGITDAYTKLEVDAKVASSFKPKGSVANFASLPTTGQQEGDVWNLLDTGKNVVWVLDLNNTGNPGWDDLSGTVDLSGYALQSWVTSNFASATHTHSWTQITGKPDFHVVATSGNYSDLNGLPTIPTQYTDEMAQDAVGAMASSEFTYNDATNTFGINAIGANKITQSASYRFVTDVEKNTWNAKQAALSGTGFVKISGSTISYDNNTYSLSSHNHTLDSLSNVTINLNTAGEILKWNGTAWVNNTLAEAGIQPAGNYASATHSHAISDVSGLQSALDGKVDDSQVLTNVPAGAVFTDTVYSHPTNSGNKHIPAGGSAGQILRWSADGTAVWGADNNTTYSQATTSILGLVKPFHANLTAPTIQGATATAGRYYGIQLNSSGQMVVNVPWVDTTYPAGTYANIDTSDDKVKVWTGEILKEYFDNYIRTSHAANSVTSTLINNWNTAVGWGNHAGLYLPLTGGQLTGDLRIKYSPSLILPTHEFKTNQADGRNDFYLRSDDFSKIIRFTTANSYYLFDIAGGMSASNSTGFDFIQIPAWNSQFRVGYYATQMPGYMSAVSGSSWTGGNMDTGGNVNAGSKVTAEDGFVHNQYDDPNFLLTSDGGVIHKKDSILPKVVQTVQDFQYLDLTVNLEFREYQVIIWNDAATINIPAASSAIMGMKIVIKLVESTTIYYGYPILEVDGNQWGTIFNDHKVGVELVCRGDSWVSTLIGQTTEIVL